MPLIAGDTIPPSAFTTRASYSTTAAVIMSVFLIATSLVTMLLISPAAFAEGGEPQTAGRWPTWRTSMLGSALRYSRTTCRRS